MGRKPSIHITLTKEEVNGLKAFLTSLIGKGSLSTTPSWARRLIGKINEAVEQKEEKSCQK